MRSPYLVGLLTVLASCLPVVGTVSAQSLEVEIVTDQADAALEILQQRAAGGEVTEAHWAALWASTGYQRLAARQASFGDEETRQRQRDFLSSDAAVELLPQLQKEVTDWKTLDITAAAERAAAYLPRGLPLRASLFPVIKQRTNSFVHDLDSAPAIFMYVGRAPAPEKLDNTLAHELHHVGIAGCPQPGGRDSLAPAAQRVVDWLSAFGEGVAMLAAAGSPDRHPHATSPADEWVIWERDIANFNRDLVRLEAFFQDILDGAIAETAQRERLFTFINADDVPQGAFYTVGWKMSALVERARGRETLVASLCDPRQLLAQYNAVAGERASAEGPALAQWSTGFLQALEGVEGHSEPQ